MTNEQTTAAAQGHVAVLPCPFCGGPAMMQGGADVGYFAECEDACTSHIQNEADAIAAWNRRAALQAPGAEPGSTTFLLWPASIATPELEPLRWLIEAASRRALSIHETDQLVGLVAALPAARGDAAPVAWSRDGLIHDDSGVPIGTDETEIHWGSEPPGEDWHPLYAAPPPTVAGEG